MATPDGQTAEAPAPPPGREPSRLPGTVVALGVVSLLTDTASEMIFPLLPLFLTTSLGAGPAFLGLVEGAADAVASLLKLVSGQLSDRLRRRKGLVLFGYGLAGLVRPLVALAAAPWHVLAIRLTDRVGKGIRSAPRDALIADAALPGQAGRAFGFHRAMDHAGAIAGPLIATALLAAGFGLREVFWFAAIPSALSVAVVLLVRERREAPTAAALARDVPAPALVPGAAPAGTLPAAKGTPLPRPLRTYLGILLLFSLGNSSDAFLLLRARDLGLADAALPTLWAVLHVSKLLSSWFGGSLADHLPRWRLIVAGWAVYALVYLGLGAASEAWHGWALFVVYGVYYGLTEPAEKALVKDLAPEDARGRAFGYYNFIVGGAALPASLLTGALWREFGPQVALGAGAALAGVAALALVLWSTRGARPASTTRSRNGVLPG